jgi:DNA-binding NarL/FixJ family response regulator
LPHLILNVDDHESNRYIRTQVLKQAGYRVVEAGTGKSAMRCFQAERPSLVLLDMNLPDMSGLDVCRWIRTLDFESRVVIVQISAISTETRHQVAGLESGAHAYLTEPVESALLVATVRSLLDLGPADREREEVGAERVEFEKALSSHSDLTTREREVLTLIVAGQSTKEIAYSLGITFKTAACHRNRILGKFGAHNTAEVVRRAISEGLLGV